jgi:hypothetical protein
MEIAMITFTGRDGVRTYQAIALKHGLILYANARIRPNRAWTPTKMLRLASTFTGKHYQRGEYLRAAQDVSEWIAANGTTGRV